MSIDLIRRPPISPAQQSLISTVPDYGASLLLLRDRACAYDIYCQLCRTVPVHSRTLSTDQSGTPCDATRRRPIGTQVIQLYNISSNKSSAVRHVGFLMSETCEWFLQRNEMHVCNIFPNPFWAFPQGRTGIHQTGINMPAKMNRVIIISG